MICRHCCSVRANRPRGLCWSCYYTPGVRDLYPPDPIHGCSGIGNFYGGYRPPPEPTRAWPGSAEKIDVLSHRAAMGFRLWHPKDNPGDEEQPLPLPVEIFHDDPNED